MNGNGIQRLAWTPAGSGEPYLSPSSLAPYQRDGAVLEVGGDQVALLVKNRVVAGVLLPGSHGLFTGRGNDLPHAEPQDILVFLSLRELPQRAWEWPEAMAGKYAVTITEPRSFYNAFLRNSEDLGYADFFSVLDRLVHYGIELAAQGTPPLPTTQELRDGVHGRLVTLGIALTSFEVTDDPSTRADTVAIVPVAAH